MPNLNKVFLMGNLTRDPELRYSQNNMAICKMGLAVNRRWRNQQGEQQEEVTFVDCTAFGRTGEVINQYLKKGKPIFIEGRLHLDQWQDKDGNKRSKLDVTVETFEFIDSRGVGDGGGGDGDHSGGGSSSSSSAASSSAASAGAPRSAPAPQQRPAPAPRQTAPAAPQGFEEPHQAIGDDDIPF
ncbi:MAG: single-stranded DNA-binding protein [Phycisphaeraceae bacterium]